MTAEFFSSVQKIIQQKRIKEFVTRETEMKSNLQPIYGLTIYNPSFTMMKTTITSQFIFIAFGS